MTDEEAWELSELFAKNPPKVSKTSKGGILMRNKGVKLIVIDDNIAPIYPRMLATRNSLMVSNIARKEMAMA